MFLDEAIITVHGGNGGDGAVSWRREKYVPKGGPDGGNGGMGGDVILQADINHDTLSDYVSRKRFEAEHGDRGSGKRKAGRDGVDLILKVPPGTIVTELIEDGTQEPLGELLSHGDQMLISRGGRGGFGNSHFKSATRQRPSFAELGEPGHQNHIKLELKLVADIGIIGYPSVGKSTLISVISAARPKIGDYPFTTLVPNLGVVTAADRAYVVCDVPGLIEGASEGKGLGDKFLRHIERCAVLLHVLDVSRAFSGGVVSGEPNADLLVKDYKAIRKELEAYSPALAKKREIVTLNKTDLIGNIPMSLEEELGKSGIKIFLSISAATRYCTDELTKKLLPIVLDERENREQEPVEDHEKIPVLKPHLDLSRMGAYRIDQLPDLSIVIHGSRLEQFTKMTNFDNEGAKLRFTDVLERIGLMKAIRRIRKEEGLPVYIGSQRVDMYL